jgi:hypothetical protein
LRLIQQTKDKIAVEFDYYKDYTSIVEASSVNPSAGRATHHLLIPRPMYNEERAYRFFAPP